MKKIQKDISRTIQSDYGSKTKSGKTTLEKQHNRTKDKKTLSDIATETLNKKT